MEGGGAAELQIWCTAPQKRSPIHLSPRHRSLPGLCPLQASCKAAELPERASTATTEAAEAAAAASATAPGGGQERQTPGSISMSACQCIGTAWEPLHEEATRGLLGTAS